MRNWSDRLLPLAGKGASRVSEVGTLASASEIWENAPLARPVTRLYSFSSRWVRSCTASAVMADVIDLARGLRLPTFGQPATGLTKPIAAKTATPAPYYLRMTLLDKPGALAKIATSLGEAGVSIDQMRQYGHEGVNAPVLIVTHKATRDDIDHAVGLFAGTGVLVGTPVVLRIEAV